MHSTLVDSLLRAIHENAFRHFLFVSQFTPIIFRDHLSLRLFDPHHALTNKVPRYTLISFVCSLGRERYAQPWSVRVHASVEKEQT
jgi:hypothetical protein